VLRRVTGRVEHAKRHIADRQLLVVREAGTLWRINRLVHDMARTNRVGKRSPSGDVIGVNVGVDDVRDTHTRLATHLLVRADVFDRIDHNALALAAAAEKVRRADGRRVEELAKDHVLTPA